MAFLSPMLGWDRCGKDLYQHVKFKVQKQEMMRKRKSEQRSLCHSKANRIRFVSSQNSQRQTPTESQMALKPKQQFIKDTSDKTSNEKN